MDLMFQPLRKYADFTGRARRSEYWLFCLLVLGIQLLFSILLNAADGGSAAMDPSSALGMSGAALILGLVFVLVMLGLFLPSLAVGIRRLHDINRTGWWTLIALVPFLGMLVLLIFYVLDGTAGPNPFGPDPKGRQEAGATPIAA